MEKQENTQKRPIFAMYAMNGDVVMVCNHNGSYKIINRQFLGI